jgi:hypothetical protein
MALPTVDFTIEGEPEDGQCRHTNMRAPYACRIALRWVWRWQAYWKHGQMSKDVVWLEVSLVKCVEPEEIHVQLADVYGVQVMSGNQTWIWCRVYGNGSRDVDDKLKVSNDYQSSCAVRDLSFSQERCWGLRSSGMWHCVFGFAFSDVSKEHNVSIFKGLAVQAAWPWKMKELCSLETLGTIHTTESLRIEYRGHTFLSDVRNHPYDGQFKAWIWRQYLPSRRQEPRIQRTV